MDHTLPPRGDATYVEGYERGCKWPYDSTAQWREKDKKRDLNIKFRVEF